MLRYINVSKVNNIWWRNSFSALYVNNSITKKKSNNIKEICALANKPILSGTEYIVYQQKVLACASILCSKFSQRVKETLRNK